MAPLFRFGRRRSADSETPASPGSAPDSPRDPGEVTPAAQAQVPPVAAAESQGQAQADGPIETSSAPLPSAVHDSEADWRGGAHDSLLARALEGWREEVRGLAGTSGLTDIGTLRGALLDLTHAHPGGVAQLYASRPTRLSNLVREASAFQRARTSTRAVIARAEEIAQRFYSAPLYLVIGEGRWVERTAAGNDDGGVRLVHAPLLMRPIEVDAAPGDDADFDLFLQPGLEINPALVQALRSVGADMDLDALARMSVTEHGFSPRATLARLTDLGEKHLDEFEAAETIYVGPFVHPGQLVLDDLEEVAPLLAGHPVVRALAGDLDVKRGLAQPLSEVPTIDRLPDAERGVGDLDPAQQAAVEQVVSGRHLLLDARTGSEAPVVVAAILADAAASGRSVVYLPGNRRAARSTVSALVSAGLSDLVLDLQESSWRSAAPERLASGLEPWKGEFDEDAVRRTRADLTAARLRLEDYTAALHRTRDPWGISAHDALQQLADMTTSTAIPRTTVRLDRDALGRLDETTRPEAADRLSRLAILGGFSDRGEESPWFGANVRSGREATEALERTQVLSEVILPKVLSDIGRITRETGLETATTLHDWLEQIEMLRGVRESLDIFQPVIFERSAADMVIATATPAWRKEHKAEMPASVRRRLTKQAQDMLRPGRPVHDLHAALRTVQLQREVWRRHCPAGGWPRLPHALGDAERTATDARDQLEGLRDVFPKEDLFATQLPELRERLLSLGGDPAALRYLPEMNSLILQLDHLGLGDLVEDLRARHVTAEAAPAELELAWWASVLETLLGSDPMLAGIDGEALNHLAESFRRLDREHVRMLAGPVRRAVDRRMRRTVAADKTAAQQYWLTLRHPEQASVRQVRAAYPELVRSARPVWVVPPLAVPQALPPERDIDLLVIDGAAHLPAAQVVAAIARSRQVVVVGDATRPGSGIVNDLVGTLPSVVLPTGRKQRQEHIASFLAGAGHGAEDVVPSPPSPSSIRLHLVDGVGETTIGGIAVEGTPAEVAAVVELVREHVADPARTVAVISLSEVTAEAVSAALAADPQLREVLADKARLVVTGVEDARGLARDTVILSVGFGKTPHGRVIHRFGAVSSTDGLALLTDALDAVRQDLEIVSSLAPDDLDQGRLHHSGAQLLHDLLDYTSDRPAEPGSTKARSLPAEGELDRLLQDLASRLTGLGLTVAPRYGFEGGVRLPLAVGHPDRPGELFVAVLTDDADYVAEPSIRRRDRHWVDRLEARGWAVHIAYSTAVFMDPQAEARAIGRRVAEAMAARPAPGVELPEVAVDGERPSAAVTEPSDGGGVGLPADSGLEDAGSVASGPDTAEFDTAAIAADGAGHRGEPEDGVAEDTAAADGTASGAPEHSPGEDAAAADDVASDAQEDSPGEDAPADDTAGDPPVDVETEGEVDGSGEEPDDGPVEGAEDQRLARPDIPRGFPAREYTDNQLDSMVAWIAQERPDADEDALVGALREELGITRRGPRADGVLRAAVARRNA